MDFQEKIRLHNLWIIGDPNGVRANLIGANLSGADLSRANLSRANLSRADLSGANISETDFSRANLFGANLSGVYLSGANLSGANLSETDLSGANLSRANLSRADLSGANLSRADLSGAYLCPTEMLLAQWGEVSDNLCRMAMAYNAAHHADPKAFDIWKETGVCPYMGTKFTRVCNFKERRDLWDSNLICPRGFDLMVALIREKCANSDYHDKSA